MLPLLFMLMLQATAMSTLVAELIQFLLLPLLLPPLLSLPLCQQKFRPRWMQLMLSTFATQLKQLPMLPQESLHTQLMQLLPTQPPPLFSQLHPLLPLLQLSLMGSGMPQCTQRPLLSPTE